MKKIVSLFCASLLMLFLYLAQAEGTSGVTSQSIEPAQFAMMLQKPKDAPVVIDVREPNEFAADGLKGALNIPLGSIENRLNEIPKDKQVLLMCRSGRRSSEAATKLVANGYNNVVNLNGGMIAWREFLKAPAR